MIESKTPTNRPKHYKINHYRTPKDMAYCQYVKCPNKGKYYLKEEMLHKGKLVFDTQECLNAFDDSFIVLPL